MAAVIRSKRGDTLTLLFQWRASADAGADPVDLTDCTARFQARTKAGALVLTATSADGEITIDGPAGDVSVRVEADVMQDVPKGSYRCDLEVTFPPDDTVRSTDTITLVIAEDQTKPDEAAP